MHSLLSECISILLRAFSISPTIAILLALNLSRIANISVVKAGPSCSVIFVESFSNQIGIIMIHNKLFANLLQIMTLTIVSHLMSPCYENGNANQQNIDDKASRKLKLMDGLH